MNRDNGQKGPRNKFAQLADKFCAHTAGMVVLRCSHIVFAGLCGGSVMAIGMTDLSSTPGRCVAAFALATGLMVEATDYMVRRGQDLQAQRARLAYQQSRHRPLS